MESNPEYFIPGEKSSHKPPKATQHGVEARPVAEGNPERGRGRGRGRGKGRGRGRGRGRFSKLPSATDLARRILEAEQVMEQSSSYPEMAIDYLSPNRTTFCKPNQFLLSNIETTSK